MGQVELHRGGNGTEPMMVAVATSSRVIRGERQGETITTKLLIDYLAKSYAEVVAVDHPFPVDPDITPLMSVYEDSELVSTERFPLPSSLARGTPSDYEIHGSRTPLKYFAMKLLDFISDVYFIVGTRKRFRLFIGVEGINTMAGLFLKRLGRVGAVVYYSYDYSDRRFPASRLASRLFVLQDRLCLRNADVCWDALGTINRPRPGIDLAVPPISAPANDMDFVKRQDHRLVYIGGLDPFNGTTVAIEAMPLILENVPDAHLDVIGAGRSDYVAELKSLTSKLNIEENVEFHGFLPDDKVRAIFRECRVGLCPYQPFDRAMNDSSKARYYALTGIPIVCTTAKPSMADSVAKFGSGLVCLPDARSIGTAASRLLTDDALYEDCLQNCRKMAASSNSDRAYELLLKRSLEIIADYR